MMLKEQIKNIILALLRNGKNRQSTINVNISDCLDSIVFAVSRWCFVHHFKKSAVVIANVIIAAFCCYISNAVRGI